MKYRITNIICLAIALISTAIALSVLPDTVPVHFDIYGVADRWGSKYELLVLPITVVLMQLIGDFSIRSNKKLIEKTPDEKKAAEAKANNKLVSIVFSVTAVLMVLINFYCLYMSFSQLDGDITAAPDIMKPIVIIMGITFIIFGNYMPKAKKNHLVGFRFPWTMYNDVTWAKCNRMSGVAGVILGIVVCALGIILNGIWTIVAMLVSLGIFCVVLLAYAYMVYRDEKKKEFD